MGVKGRVLILGGTGFLGRHTARAFSVSDWDVISTGQKDGDLRSEGTAFGLFQKYQPDVVVHLAATCGGIGANVDRPYDYWLDNTLMGAHVIDACLHAGVSRLVLAGTVCAYPLSPPVPFREESLWDGYPEPTNAPYGVAKKNLLIGADACHAQHGLSTVALLPTNLYGPGDNFDLRTSHVIPALIRKVMAAQDEKRREVTLWGTGKASRDFLFVTDAARAFVLAAEKKGTTGVFNIGSGREVNIAELAHLVARLLEWNGTFAWDAEGLDGQPRRVLDSSKAHRVLGWEPEVSLQSGLASTIAWWMNQCSKSRSRSSSAANASAGSSAKSA